MLQTLPQLKQYSIQLFHSTDSRQPFLIAMCELLQPQPCTSYTANSYVGGACTAHIWKEVGKGASGIPERRIVNFTVDSHLRSNNAYCVNGCVAELERLLLTGKSQMRVTEPFRGNWARAETADGSYESRYAPR